MNRIFTLRSLFLALIVLLFVFASIEGVNGQNDGKDNKFKRRKKITNEFYDFGIDASEEDEEGKCHIPIDLIWKAELGAGVYNTPIIIDTNSDGSKEIVVATSQSFVEVLRSDGTKAHGWPFAFASSSFLASPLVYDVEGDARNEIILTTQNGEIIFLNENGLPEKGKTLKVPPLRVRKDWSQGLLQNNADFSMSLNEQRSFDSENHQRKGKDEKVTNTSPYGVFSPLFDERNATTFGKSREAKKPMKSSTTTNARSPLPEPTKDTGRKLKSLEEEEVGKGMRRGGNKGMKKKNPHIFEGMEGYLSKEALESFDIFFTTKTPANYIHHIDLAENDPLFSPQFNAWMNQEEERNKLRTDNDKYVYVDAHVLHTPIVTDLDYDGNLELIVPVSYYFDSSTYSDPEAMKSIDVDVKLTEYVAAGIVVFDLKSESIQWTLNLDITSDNSNYPSYLNAAPVVADFDADGRQEILIGTGLGHIYIISSEGKIRRQFSMDSIFAPIVVEDVNGDGELEIIATDQNSNVVCFNSDGIELWERRIAGYANQAPVIGDIDGDGKLEVVIGTNEGHIWALRGENGEIVPNYPMKFSGRILSQPLLINLGDLSSTPQTNGLHIVFSAQDGFLYIINGKSNCVERIDLGEPSYGMVLADDITGDGKMNLVVTTRNGNIYLLGLETPYHPLKSWTSFNQGRNGFTAREGYQGIFVSGQSRGTRDIRRESFSVQFEIVDNRPKHAKQVYYKVQIFWGYYSLFEKNYTSPGVYVEHLTSPSRRVGTMIHIIMTNEFGQAFFDSFAVTFHLYFYRVLKWLLVLPLFAITGATWFLFRQESNELPIT